MPEPAAPGLDPAPTVSVLRNRLAGYVEHVHTRDAVVEPTSDGHPAGLLLSPGRALREGHRVQGTWSVDAARKDFAAVRERAAEQGPQALTGRSGASAVLVAPKGAPQLEAHPSVRYLRDKLGDYVAHAHRGGRVPLSVQGRPAGALVAMADVEQAGLRTRGTWSVDAARKDFAAVRERAAEQGPQAIRGRSGDLAALVSPEHARVLEQGHPVLEAEGVAFDPRQGAVRTFDGRVLEPGTYTYQGVLKVLEPGEPAPHEPAQS